MRKKKITVCSAIQVGRGEVLESRHLLTGIPFSEPLSISAPQESFTGQVEDLALTDLDRDGDLDVLMVRVTADQQGESIWHLNDGDGNFTEATRRNLGSVDSQNLTLADINGDGAVDIVARQSKLVWYENTGAENSVFAEEAQDLIPTEQQVDLTSLLSISDFDNDGLNDLLMLKYLGGQDLQFVWMENLGDDGFESHPLSGALVPRYTSSNAVLARDVDVDGDLDIVVNNGEVASYFENTIDEGNGFTDPVVMKFEDSGIDITYLETTDVDHDGDEDLLVFDRAGGRVVDGEFIQNSGIVYWAENSAGTFAEPRKLEEFDVGEQVVTPHSTLIRMDIDGDGFVEPVMVNRYASRELLYYTNAQQGMLQRHSQNDSPHQGDVGDIDGDGDLDWVYSNHRGNRVLWLDSVGPDVSENVVAKTDLFEPGELAVLDFDADGDNDAVLLSDLELKWYENTGEGQFAPIVALGVRPDYYLRLVDFNGDARPDVFYSVYDESKEATSFVWKANLETGLSVPQELTIDVFPRSLADIDGDGDLDIIGRRSGEAGHVAYLNDGSGVFDESITLPFESERGLFVVTDSDGDGDMDIITDEDTRVSIYENDGNGQYSSRGLSDAVDHPLFPGTPLGYQAVRLEDMDSDGDEDLVLLYRGFNSTLAGTSNHLEIFENQGGEFALVFETNIRQNQSVRGLRKRPISC